MAIPYDDFLANLPPERVASIRERGRELIEQEASLRQLRERLGDCSQEMIAKALGIKQSSVDGEVYPMDVVRGTWIDGRIVLDDRAEWPDGTRVEVMPSNSGIELPVMCEENWPTDRRGIEELLARMDESEPLEITPEEERDQAAWRREIANYTKMKMENDAKPYTDD